MLATGTLDLARTDEAPAVGEQDDLEQHGRRVGAGTGEVVLVAGIKAAEIESVIDQIIQGVFKGAGKQLPFEIDGDEAGAGVYGLVAGHEYLSRRISSWSLVIPFGSRQDARMKQLFLQLR